MQFEEKSLEIIQKQEREITIISKKPMKNAIIIQPATSAKIAKEKTPKIILKKILIRRINLKSLIK